jgi:L-ascorbate metabolism protein UlaG (beta-lactamase superfamily)
MAASPGAGAVWDSSAEKPNRWRRRALLGTGALGLAGTGIMLYRAAPGFWQQYSRELLRPVAPPPAVPDPASWPNRGIHASWLGHSTVLLKVEGVTILTDPVFSTRAGIHLGLVTLGVKRLVEPPVSIPQLPRIDLILLSHAHMDHMDLPSLTRLESHMTHVVTAPQTSDLLRVGRFASVQELRWGESLRVGAAQVRALEVNHWGARVRTDVWRGYAGYLIAIGRYRVLFGGDTAWTEAFKGAAGSRSVDLAIMPIGAYNPWRRFHCTPEEAWRMAQDARAERILPVHHSTFLLSREPVGEPLERLRAAVGADQSRIVGEELGSEVHLS